jgi:hypothetical protein
MNDGRQDSNLFGFVKTFVLPADPIFLLPAISLISFLHARDRFDAAAREPVLAGIRSDPTVPRDPRRRFALGGIATGRQPGLSIIGAARSATRTVRS